MSDAESLARALMTSDEYASTEAYLQHLAEQIADGKLTPQQALDLSTARAIADAEAVALRLTTEETR